MTNISLDWTSKMKFNSIKINITLAAVIDKTGNFNGLTHKGLFFHSDKGSVVEVAGWIFCTKQSLKDLVSISLTSRFFQGHGGCYFWPMDDGKRDYNLVGVKERLFNKWCYNCLLISKMKLNSYTLPTAKSITMRLLGEM